MEIKNLELLAKAGLEAVTDEEGNVTIQKKLEELVNGGKWLPKPNKSYCVVCDAGINSRAHHFTSFDYESDYERRKLKEGLVFPNLTMANKVVNAYKKAITDVWEEYEKTLNALNGEQNDESES